MLSPLRTGNPEAPCPPGTGELAGPAVVRVCVPVCTCVPVCAHVCPCVPVHVCSGSLDFRRRLCEQRDPWGRTGRLQIHDHLLAVSVSRGWEGRGDGEKGAAAQTVLWQLGVLSPQSAEELIDGVRGIKTIAAALYPFRTFPPLTPQ